MKRLFVLIGLLCSISCNKNVGMKAIDNASFVLCSTPNVRVPAVDAFQAKAMKDYAKNGPVYQSNNTVAPTYVIYISYGGDVTSGIWTPTTTAGSSGYVAAQMDEAERALNEDFSTYVYTLTRDVNVYNAAPVGRRGKVIVGTGLAGLTVGAVGKTYPGSGIGLVQESPSLVMSEYSLPQVQYAISHEVGHLIALYHIAQWTFNPCVMINGTDPGVGPPLGAESWGRLMGNSFRSLVTLDYNGPRDLDFDDANGCPTYQNDWAVVNATMPYKTDGDWDTFGIGHTYRTISLGQTVNGTIVGGGDKDIIKVAGTTGLIHIELSTDGNTGHVGNTELMLKVWNGGIFPNSVAVLNGTPYGLTGQTYTLLSTGTNYLMVMSRTDAPWLPLPNSCGQWALKIY